MTAAMFEIAPRFLWVLLFIFASVSSAVAIQYCFLSSRLAKRLSSALSQRDDLRLALRERDAAGREPERIAFQSGYRNGLRAATAAAQPVEIETTCDCPRCRAQNWTRSVASCRLTTRRVNSP